MTITFDGLDLPEAERVELLRRLLNNLCRPHEAERLLFLVERGPAGIFINGENIVLTLTDIEQATLTIKPVSAAGNPAPVDGVPVWTSSDPTLVQLNVAPDGLSAAVIAVGPITPTGSPVQVVVTADADLGSGVRTITGRLDVAVIASEAATLSITAGAPSPKP